MTNAGPASWEGLVRVQAQGPDGRLAQAESGGVTVGGGARQEVRILLDIQRAALWSLEAPGLYDVTVSLVGREGGVDFEARDRTGFRRIQFDPEKGFLLNDQRVKIQGMCNHQVRRAYAWRGGWPHV
jgi:beta-galactosidase